MAINNRDRLRITRHACKKAGSKIEHASGSGLMRPRLLYLTMGRHYQNA
jgi:hypothetical protein